MPSELPPHCKRVMRCVCTTDKRGSKSRSTSPISAWCAPGERSLVLPVRTITPSIWIGQRTNCVTRGNANRLPALMAWLEDAAVFALLGYVVGLLLIFGAVCLGYAKLSVPVSDAPTAAAAVHAPMTTDTVSAKRTPVGKSPSKPHRKGHSSERSARKH